MGKVVLIIRLWLLVLQLALAFTALVSPEAVIRWRGRLLPKASGTRIIGTESERHIRIFGVVLLFLSLGSAVTIFVTRGIYG